MSTNEHAPVVVGVDGSAAADGAVAWAAQAAAERDVPLEIVHAWALPWLGTMPDVVTMDPVPYEEGAQGVLDAALAYARELPVAVELRSRLVRGQTSAALLSAAATGSLLVVGSHGHSWRRHRLLGSVSQQCAAHSHGTVVVVPREWDGNRHGRVVVGVDGSQDSYGALHFAAHEAGRYGAELDVVHAWHVPRPSGMLPREALAHHADLEKLSHCLLDEMSAAVGPGSATVPRPASVECISVEGDPARSLVSTARGADLLVVGSRGHGGFAGLLLGSVSQRCLQHTGCPVAVTHR